MAKTKQKEKIIAVPSKIAQPKMVKGVAKKSVTRAKKIPTVTREKKRLKKNVVQEVCPVPVIPTIHIETCAPCRHLPMGGTVLVSLLLIVVFMLSAVVFVAAEVVKKQNVIISAYQTVRGNEVVITR